MKLLGIMLMTTLLAMAPGHGSAEPGKDIQSPATQPKGTEEQATPVPAAKKYTLQERQTYQKQVAADLDKLQKKIEDLHQAMVKASPQMKRTTYRILAGLRKQLLASRNQLAALEKASEKEWSGLKGRDG